MKKKVIAITLLFIMFLAGAGAAFAQTSTSERCNPCGGAGACKCPPPPCCSSGRTGTGN